SRDSLRSHRSWSEVGPVRQVRATPDRARVPGNVQLRLQVVSTAEESDCRGNGSGVVQDLPGRIAEAGWLMREPHDDESRSLLRSSGRFQPLFAGGCANAGRPLTSTVRTVEK